MDDTHAPYIRLWAMVMALAVKDARNYIRRNKLHQMPHPGSIASSEIASAFIWLLSEERYPGGFLWACDLFDLNPQFVREQLLKARPAGAVKKLSEMYDDEDL